MDGGGVMSATILIVGDWYGSYASLSFEVGVGVRGSDMSDILSGRESTIELRMVS